VKKARLGGEDVGLAMLKMLDKTLGYVYYVAVSPKYRGRGVGGFLLDQSIDYFFSSGAVEVFAAAEEDNIESIKLFESRNFGEISYGDLSRKYGRIKAARLWAKMLVVPGEILMSRTISARLAPP
jgi:ribosomal protein S18 acetylase RimI-like enzyme